MIRSFIVGNALVGLVSAVVSTVVFWRLGIPYFYFLGVISGFVSLIPYLGVFLALLPPLAAGTGVVNKTGVGIIMLTVIGLHLLSMHVLYPKMVGQEVEAKSIGGNAVFAFLGVDLGSDGSGTRRASGGSHQDRLRLRRSATGARSLPGRLMLPPRQSSPRAGAVQLGCSGHYHRV